ncbi:hypothetical protein B9Z19DRAFT_1191398 [Tuber borchii]|uniref:Uncharacterized protein n=1 Tax=Tuber borchii TaxID=42251 RepID=A0A2T7A056_TUBBO|nr:hypothetical protein B9Z19DRAFT_1191398 [Tuber borchii]
MSYSSNEGMSGHSVPIDRGISPSSGNEGTIPQSPNSSCILLQALLDPANANTRPAPLACPVSGCSSVFQKKAPHGYLWRHLKRPRADGRTGDEKDACENLHRIEHDRLLSTRLNPAERKREAREVKVEKRLRTTEFELRARSMGITEDALVAQKVKFWEEMWVAKQNGEDIEKLKYDALVLLDFFTNS